jgi:tetratricopeptide (TPR) repeat protein
MRQGPQLIGTTPAERTQVEKALALRSAGKLSEALEMLSQANECSSYLTAVRGEIEFALGRFHDAALSYFTVAASEPENAGAHYNLALCLQRSERWDAAAQAFERVLRLDSRRAGAGLGLGICLLQLNRAEEALTLFNQRCTGTMKGPALFGKAVALQLLHRLDEARTAYEMLLASDLNSEEVLSNLIALSIETHDLESAREHSLRLLTLCPRSMAALQGLATVALQYSEGQGAASYCDRILELAPGCLEAWHNFRIAIEQWRIAPAQPAICVISGRK